MRTDKEIARENAEKRVKELKGYYSHITIFVIVNGILLFLKTGVLNSLLPEAFPKESHFYDWIYSNVLLWALILALHTVFILRHRFTFFKTWEERQIQKYMDEDRDKIDKYK
nr:2TM domain-containing protein [uncultured Allomuricauda sp.]